MNLVRRYMENCEDSRRCQLSGYFDCSLVKTLPRRDPLTCCDVCVEIHSPELQKLTLHDHSYGTCIHVTI